MMAMTADDILEHIRSLPEAERQRLVERVTEEAAAQRQAARAVSPARAPLADVSDEEWEAFQQALRDVRRVSPVDAGFDALSVPEQLAHVESLWSRIVAREHSVPVPASHLAELQRRMADHQADLTNTRPAAEVEAALRAKLAERRAR